MRELLERCLASVEKEMAADWETIVVINGDDDGTVSMLSRRFPWARLIVNPSNRGVGPARNQGWAVARGTTVIFMDADTSFQEGILTALGATLEQDRSIGVVGPRLVSPEGEKQKTARSFPTLWTKLRRRAPMFLRSMLPSDELPDSEKPLDVGYVIGACQVIRRSALEAVGPFDERIFYGPEDVDLCLRMWKAGWRVVWDPRHVVVHHEQRSTKRHLLSRLTLRHAQGLIYFFAKHRYLFRAPAYASRVPTPVSM
jgi:hypothetical protein